MTLESLTIEDIENHKIISSDKLIADLDNLRNLPVNNNYSLHGNRFLYHHQIKNLMRCTRGRQPTLYNIYADEERWKKLLSDVRTRNRCGTSLANDIFECYRINNGSIVMFKASAARHIYHKYGATSVLDPTAGWGGRMLGAWSLDIDYTGIDTNIEMISAYDQMIDFLNTNVVSLYSSNMKMIWDSCLNVDFSKIEYDFVLTSPPYINMELYEHMPKWESNKSFYTEFFIPLWEKCVKHIKPNGHVCFNISPKMYQDAIKYGLIPCDIEEDFNQQLGRVKKDDKIYIWKR